MKAIMAVDYAAKSSGVSLTEIARQMGKSDKYVHACKGRGSTPRCDIVAKMLEICGWRLVAVPAKDVPKSAIVLDSFNDRA